MADARELRPIDRKVDRCPAVNTTSWPIKRHRDNFSCKRFMSYAQYFKNCLVLVAMTAVMVGGTAPAFTAAISPMLLHGKVPNHHRAYTFPWIPVISLIVAGVAALATVAMWWGTRQTRLDRKLKRAEQIRGDTREQARRIREAEDLIEALVTKINGIHTEISTMADIRDRASVDPGRPLRLQRAAFSLHRSLFPEYESHSNRYRSDLRDLKRKLAQCQQVLSCIVSAPWPISPTNVSYRLLSIEDSSDRLVDDTGVVLNEASVVIRVALDAVMSLKDQVTGGGNETDATKLS